MGNHASKSTAASNTSITFTDPPLGVTMEIFRALSLKEKAALASASNHYAGLFRQHIHAAKCLMLVAHGDQDAAQKMLAVNPKLLLEPADVTDYSGRTFKKITAYEYAYWAKDTHMCRMLESHMDDAIKARMLSRIDAMEKNGLSYKQEAHLVVHSKQVDLGPLIEALERYVGIIAGNHTYDEVHKAWIDIGLAQRDMPVHVLNQYCHPSASFDPTPSFDECLPLPRCTRIYNSYTMKDEWLFPLINSDASGLGVDFALTRGDTNLCTASGPRRIVAEFDLAAIRLLNERRTADRELSRANLRQRAPGTSYCLRAEGAPDGRA